MYKIIFMGTPDFGVPALEALINDPRCEVVHVFSQPDRPQGRKQEVVPTPIKEVAQKYNIPFSQPEKLRTEENIALIDALEPDFIVVVAYGKIIPKRILDIPTYGCINIHGSLLPKYRGASPIQAALLQGEQETGITIMLLSEGMDEGAMLTTAKVPITMQTTAQDLFHTLSHLGATLLPDTLDAFVKKEILPVEQDHHAATYCTKIEKEMGEIHPAEETALDIYHKWQAFTPWPGIYLFEDHKRIKIITFAPTIYEHIERDVKNHKGAFIISTDRKLYLHTHSGYLEILHIQPEGKKILTATEYIAGYQ